MTVASIVRLEPSHRADWDALYLAYADFYESPQTPEMLDRVWGWLADDRHELDGRVAIDRSGAPIGLVHFRPFARPLAANTGVFIDDLFVGGTAGR
jgi:hypothetical protein